MTQQKRIDKILQAVKARVQEEVGALLGTVFALTDESYDRVSKEDAFADLQGKQISAEMDITGEVSGKACLLAGIKDAIRLGGTLIMLPLTELGEVIGREEYSEEIEDSYGEIANIIAGSFTKDFEEMYPKSCRFVRKNQEKIVPAKVEIDSAAPVENVQLYRVSWAMSLDGTSMGNLIVLLPAVTFELEEESAAKSAQPAAEENTESTSDTNVSGEVEEVVAAQPDDAAPVKIDFEKQKKRIDRILDECQSRLQNEIGGLLGVPAVLTDIRNYFVGKEEFFEDRVTGKQIIADMEVVGDAEGNSFFCASIKDAVHLGGVLIMLPPTELEITVSEEEFGADAQDAYGEITNIISGVYTAVFEEQHTKKLRFIKKGLTEVQPAQVDIASAEPIPDALYYVSSLSLSVDGKQLGKVQMLFPAALLELFPPGHETKPVEEKPSAATPQTAAVHDENTEEEPVNRSSESVEKSQVNVTQHKAKVDKLLGLCQKKMQEEVSNLLGTDVKLRDISNKVIDKEGFFFDEVSAKQVITTLEVVGALEGKSYLAIDLRDAIRVGGTLIMLPAGELESVVSDEEFGEDAADAYGEIANIISGVYTAIFEEQYTKNIRFIRKDLQQVTPMKIEIESDEPIPDENYYQSSMVLEIGGSQYGKINLLFPLSLIELEGLLAVNEADAGESLPQTARSSDTDTDAHERSQKVTSERESLDILIIGDDEATAETMVSTFLDLGYRVKKLSFKDNIHDYLPGELKAVYLVMHEVNEQVFGSVIKISAACNLPLVAAGPGWTRSKVIKAVKYGVRDILLTPATKDQIKESINSNLLEMAA
ncbi:chemotaxis protein CheX [Desulforhopalus sp. IMCC35007]|uniref:chemotaxis protein CheX n=1 Tax=Desulforhopalus sp. IMCC35007 TaxID=2569543 RepID=UPI0010ADFBE3|nr:chemotaxis protein CheX [Desulforhopalus sp. IMCC35007]TKB10303.1 chemotaxis protein CheX [Desulforhopalus sp. IMCC35007]